MIRSNAVTQTRAPLSGVGIGVRAAHVAELLRTRPPLDFVELLTDNHLAPGGPARWLARELAEQYPVALHGVGLSLGSIDPLNRDYLRGVRDLADELGAAAVSDHVAFTRVAGREYHDLLPLPGTREALDHLVGRALEAQERLGRRLLLENASRYLPDVADAIPEHEFLIELCRRSGCGLLLDVNNAYVSQHNLGTDARRLIDTIPAEAIGYVHIAGFEAREDLLVDTHGAPVSEAVWSLLAVLARRVPQVPLMLERDRNLPPLAELLAEAWQARARVEQARPHAA